MYELKQVKDAFTEGLVWGLLFAVPSVVIAILILYVYLYGV